MASPRCGDAGRRGVGHEQRRKCRKPTAGKPNHVDLCTRLRSARVVRLSRAAGREEKLQVRRAQRRPKVGQDKGREKIERDWNCWPDANVGIVTGPESGIWVVEADTKKGHGVDGIASLAELERENGALPPTLMAESPSGSLHRYFSWPTDGAIINSASMIGPGIDVRGKGGMVIAPPSVRKDGSYRWLNDLPVAEAPPWLIKAAREKPGVPEHLKDYKSNGVGAELFGLPGRTNDELIALLEATRTPGKWHTP